MTYNNQVKQNCEYDGRKEAGIASNMDYLGLLFVAAFYVAVLVLGLCASRRILGRRSDDVKEDAAKGEDLLLAGRDLGVVAGVCTLVATEVGGAFLNGTAEEVFRSEGGGLLWCVVPIGYSISMAINGFTFAPKLREKGCVTLIDVLQVNYNQRKRQGKKRKQVGILDEATTI